MSEGLNAELLHSYNALNSSLGGKLKINSGYRSVDEQTSLWNNALAKYGSEQEARKWVAKPGSSNHNHGEAIDVGNYQLITDAMAAQYGLYRPMAHEPWHFERIGHKGNKQAYTTPQVPQKPETKVLDAFSQIIATIGEQPSVVGEQASSVGDQSSTVDGTIPVEQKTTEPENTLQVSALPKMIGAPMQSQGGSEVDRLMAAIGGQESGGNYNATNKDSGAQGKFQIMPGNWPSWSREAGLPAGAPRTPANQETVAKFKMQQYINMFGVRGAAEAWYGGPGAVGFSAAAKARKQGNYPSIKEYADQVLARMGQ